MNTLSDPGTRRHKAWALVIYVLLIGAVLLWQYLADKNFHDPVVMGCVLAVLVVLGVTVHRFHSGRLADAVIDAGDRLEIVRGRRRAEVPLRDLREVVLFTHAGRWWGVELRLETAVSGFGRTVRYLPAGWRRLDPGSAADRQARELQARIDALRVR